MANPDIFLTLKFGEKCFIDPRRMALLKAIFTTGSLSKAAKLIDISYKTAWDSINEINQLAEQPFVITTTGGKGGGGTSLSDYAIRFIELYDLLTNVQYHAFDVLKDESIPLNDVLNVAAKLSLQSSARNQFYSTIQSINVDCVAGFLTLLLSDNQTEMTVYITQSSIKRLNLVVGKSVILLIKAPQIELVTQFQLNHYKVKIDTLLQTKDWCELTLSLSSGLKMYATCSHDEARKLELKQGQLINIGINPDNIIVTSMI